MFVEHKEAGEVSEAPAKLDHNRRLLLRAADWIDTHGWCQGKYQTERGYCVIGALRAVGPDHDFRAEAILEPRVGGSVAKWNDAPERTQAEVVSKLRAVALGL